ncbi:MAG: 16S rRNA (cytidine(1402)-2'-O)-methyltransferase [Clostridia bacterium]|nr:16S rRNA (cytidine(1402)-2'-O)-methyltransferase [Clostridia bacterium]
MSGKLMLCATPIGNMGDITLRALEAMRECDVIAAEDTRCAGILLQRYEIKKPMISCHEHNIMQAKARILDMLEKGSTVVLVSDAGMPGISDPGAEIAAYAMDEGYEVTLLPGASAGITGLVLSGLDARRYCFEGFLPVKGEERQSRLEDIRAQRMTIVLYEAPHRLEKTLQDLYDTLGDRRIALARELTKLHEEVERTTLRAALDNIENKPPRGEYVVIIEGAKEDSSADTAADVETVVAEQLARGLGTKGAAKEAARLLDIPVRDAYNVALKLSKK